MRYRIFARARRYDGDSSEIILLAESYDHAFRVITEVITTGWWENGTHYYPPASFDSEMWIEEIKEDEEVMTLDEALTLDDTFDIVDQIRTHKKEEELLN